MYHNMLIQKQYPLYPRLKSAAKLLQKFMAIEYIYFSQQPDKAINKGILIVIISANSPHYWDDLAEYSWKLFALYPEFSFCIYNEEWLLEGIEEGNLFFIVHCSKEQLIYSGKGNALEWQRELDISPKRIIKLANKRLKDYTNENSIINRDLKYYMRNENYLMVAYVLHRQLRNLYICLSWLTSGEWHVLQYLHEQIEHLTKYSNLPHLLFNPNSNKDHEVLNSLDMACSIIQDGVNKEQIITKAIVEMGSEKLELALKEVESLFAEYIKRAQEILEI